MSQQDQDGSSEVTEIDDQVLRDLESKFADLRCPVHDVTPKFEVDGKGGVVERFCCDALLQIFRELSSKEKGDAGA